ncbi:gephyrin-like molybdotransferase receptor GlpR [Streptomyces sp. TP-A0874]|uniref:gephyrin-like molybdotransferase receptor GlpR n=1 Tax=Streptomyces sp. TP-A0874 TaxID=549819 RepID=UPI000853CC4A|nr:gephyrin-like molybdotransferase receptor GlpR [Streptomyces sp. TP-A0874]
MSSSGLIYAAIVGAWAAYLVPMWLRRQDELNEARPTERFSTAIRLLSGRAGMERRYAKDLQQRDSGTADEPQGSDEAAGPSGAGDQVDLRSYAVSAAMPAPAEAEPENPAAQAGGDAERAGRRSRNRQDDGERVAALPRTKRMAGTGSGEPARPEQARERQGAAPGRSTSAAALERARRSRVLARRRRTTMVLFLAFTGGAVLAAVRGLAFLWAPAVPAALLSTYIIYLRAQERRRFAVNMDRRRAEEAARQLRARRPRERVQRGARQQRPAAAESRSAEKSSDRKVEPPAPEPQQPAPEPTSPETAGRRALVEETDHAEWVDQQRYRGGEGESWEPVPVPLPTYVTAPVAPRAAGPLDLEAPDAWSSGRATAPEAAAAEARPEPVQPAAPETPAPRAVRRPAARRIRERGRTPLFDQYAEEDRPRAANE